ncbi:hypothetical protein K491DRAFT_781356 [Lophiostoma macrostomum CBS 122681]|uniref:Uncharacterized protein n=1 Tax=Lophiostoma macrostomum CBS 122681 TaxID=1314788 RepID=A0A6A6SYV3_9PLEO|nr:hypothetical protein K491DRAFT_781356 [Lophiostoma macrostomum CBS 122681]
MSWSYDLQPPARGTRYDTDWTNQRRGSNYAEYAEIPYDPEGSDIGDQPEAEEEEVVVEETEMTLDEILQDCEIDKTNQRERLKDVETDMIQSESELTRVRYQYRHMCKELDDLKNKMEEERNRWYELKRASRDLKKNLRNIERRRQEAMKENQTSERVYQRQATDQGYYAATASRRR